ncbi:MAG: aromatic ring-hydroxylating dioxygenase subunit alpha [Sandaracinaceae bacterium]
MYSIPSSRYTCPNWLQAEWSRVFLRTWLFGAHSSQLPDVGSFVRLRFGRYDIALVRQEDLTVRAFHAVCQHRGTPLCARDAGRVRSLVCPYHLWEYALDGALRSAPGAELSAPALAAVSLSEIPCEERLGFVWFRFTDQGPTLEAHLDPVAEAIDGYRPEAFRLAQQSNIEMKANWKAVLDANNESYHLRSLHPGLANILDPSRVQDEALGMHSGSRIPLGEGLASSDGAPTEATRQILRSLGVEPMPGTCDEIPGAIAAAFARELSACGVSLPRSLPLHFKRQFAVFPNVQLNFTPLHLEVYREWPHPTDPGQSRFEEISYVRPFRAPAQPAHRAGPHGSFSAGEILDADLDISTRVQQGLASGALEQVRFTTRESNAAHFHRVLTDFVQSADASAPGSA